MLTIYSVMTGCTVQEAVSRFDGRGYGEFKLAVGEAVADGLEPLRQKYEYFMQNKDYLEKIYTESADKACRLSYRMLSKVQKKIGFIKK